MTDADDKDLAPPTPPPAAGPAFRPGQPVDARDRLHKWYEATVCSIRTMPTPAIMVHFTYWSSANDEWIPLVGGETDLVTLPGRSGRVFRAGHPPRPGMLVDAYDDHPRMQKFLPAVIREINAESRTMKIHYTGFVDKFDKLFPIDSELVLPWGSRTRKRYPFRQKLTAGYGPGDGDDNAAIRSGASAAASASSSSGAAGADPAACSGAGRRRRRKPPRQLNLGTTAFERFEAGLAAKGLRLEPQAGDGNCLFRSIAHQVYGDPSLHADCRAHAVSYLRENITWLSGFVEGEEAGAEEYLEDMAHLAVWGGEPELVAFHEMYRRPIEVYSGHERSGAALIMLYASAALPGTAPVRLSYYGGGHYDSIVGADSAAALLPVASAGSTERAAIAALRSGAAAHVASRVGGAAAGASGGTDGEAALVAALAASREAFAENLMIEQALAVSLGASAHTAATAAVGQTPAPTAALAASPSSSAAGTMTTAAMLAATAATQGADAVGAATDVWAAHALQESDATGTDEELVAQAMAASQAAADEEALLAATMVESEQAAMLAAAARNEDDVMAAALAASLEGVGGPAGSALDWEEQELLEAVRRSAVAAVHDSQEAESLLVDEDLRAAIQLSQELHRQAGASSSSAGQVSSGRNTPDTASPTPATPLPGSSSSSSSSASAVAGASSQHNPAELMQPAPLITSQSSGGAAAFALSTTGSTSSPTAEDLQQQIAMAYQSERQQQ